MLSKKLCLLIALFTLNACGGPAPPQAPPPARPCLEPKPPDGIQLRLTGRKIRLPRGAAKDLIGIPLEGDIAVLGELTIPPGGWPALASGELELNCAVCRIPSMPLPVPGNLAKGGLEIPAINLGDVKARVKLSAGDVAFELRNAEAGDITLQAQGTIKLRQPVGRSSIQARVRVKVGDRLRASGTVFGLFEAMNRRNKQEDGSYLFEINGTLERIRARIQAEQGRPGSQDGVVDPYKHQGKPTWSRQPLDPYADRSAGALPEGWATKLIKKVGDGSWTIQRKLLDQILSDMNHLARAARIVPSVRNGKPNGFKLYAIRPGSIYAVLGLQNGDTITTINGYDITTPDKALRVYDLVRKANKLILSLLRRGKEITLTYEIIK